MANSLYLDTNVYLSFYHLSNDDLEELKKLSVLTNSGKLILYLPEQTKNEFYRNRDTKIADAIKRFNDNKLNNVFPQIIKDYEFEYNLMRNAAKEYEKNKQLILENIKKDIIGKNLKADLVIEKLFNNAKLIPFSESLLNQAKMRFDLGNPPGKNKSYGDALNWESLLTVVDDFDNFFFISDDKDYYSEYDNNLFNSFLLSEWGMRMPLTTFKYYKSLSIFFKEKFPEINIATELQKEHLINKLSSSSSFSETRNVLRELKNYDDFTSKQLNDIVYSAISNNQIYWIRNDDDINEYMNKIVSDKLDLIDSNYLESYKNLYQNKLEFIIPEDEILPF